MMVPPARVQARVRAFMVVVFPDPAGAIATWSRAPLVAISRTRWACPGLRVTPEAAVSVIASSTRSGRIRVPPVRPAAASSACSAARTAGLVYSWAPATV